jgi:hypothetical protein
MNMATVGAIGGGGNSAYATLNATMGDCRVHVSINVYEGEESETLGEAAHLAATLATDIEEVLQNAVDSF